MKRSPRVSVLVPVYNGARFLDETLTAISSQTYANLEIIVRDDGSTDASGDIVAAHAANDTRIRTVAGNRDGASGNVLRLLELAEGDFIKICMQDDVLAPHCVQRLVKAFHLHPGVTLATSTRRLIDETGAELAPAQYTEPLVQSSAVIHGASAARRMLLTTVNQIGEPSTVLFRNGVFKPERMYEFAGHRFDVNADIAMWLELLGRGDLYFHVDTLSSFRIHGHQRTMDVDVQVAGALEWVELLRGGLETGVLSVGAESMFAGRQVLGQLQGLIGAIAGSNDERQYDAVPTLAAAIARVWAYARHGATAGEQAA